MNEEQFVEFIDSKKIKKHGVLQKFIMPYGDKNFEIRATWNQHFCFYEKKGSKHSLNDTRYDIYERCAAFDAKTYMSKSFPLNSEIIKLVIDRWIANIIQHIKSVTNNHFQVNSMILNFVLDSKLKLNFLHCSSVKSSNVDWKDFTDENKMDCIDYQ